jgi:diacylglycerol kinase family enzyme
VLERLREAGHHVRAVPTHGPRTAGEIARAAVLSGADLILVAGGDGTLNEALEGVVHTNVPLAVLPAGTANVLATEIGVRVLEKAARRLSSWIPRRVSAGLLRTANGEVPRPFLLLAGVAGFKELGRRLTEFDVRVGGSTFRCGYALASRVRNFGGTVEMTPGASLLRDEFEVVLFEGANPFRYLGHLGAVFAGGLEGRQGVRILKALRVEFSAPSDPPVYMQVDGEAAGTLPASIEIVPEAVTLLVPPDFRG